MLKEIFKAVKQLDPRSAPMITVCICLLLLISNDVGVL